jgi:hypothetical protein
MTGRFSGIAVLLLLALWLGGCVPAIVPDQLAHTPGPAVQVVNGRYANANFTVHYPDGWRVVSSAASATEMHVMFIAPEDAAVIVVGEGAEAPTLPNAESLRHDSTVKPLNGRDITVILSAPRDDWERYFALWQQVVDSLDTPN